MVNQVIEGVNTAKAALALARNITLKCLLSSRSTSFCLKENPQDAVADLLEEIKEYHT